ncbi:malto-oligosyltrehalose synthase [Immundisolibacter sp.]|uniref:malto-oligosyltrehalose synthase n=1 Tax=Immundisolibacter sp. TaxID=1934948 RepID=UPI00261EFD4B|nr:malto-oligosyltrehalose synthase [Immundisolibacter sp.]MDD3650866.1 malto-oligosyltrehalose synthase [Immundisolibacter sp.]
MNGDAAVGRLAECCGIAPGYRDVWGRWHSTGVATSQALLAAMGLDPRADPARLAAALEDADWHRPLAPVLVHALGAALDVPLTLPAGAPAQRWRLTLEDGSGQAGAFDPAGATVFGERRCDGILYRRYVLELPPPEVTGYHQLELESAGADDRPPARLTLIVVPVTCFQPPAIGDQRRLWGPTVQLYGLRSARNWGIGDFTDLATLISLTAEVGGGLVGINPLHALFPDQPERCSPYSPSSRRFLNALYVDVDAVIAANDAACTRQYVAEPRFQARLQELRDAELVDYAAVAALKLEVLQQTWRAFVDQHLGSDSPRAAAFERFRAAGGEALQRHALFEALQAHLHGADPAVWGWPAWPAEYHDPNGAAVRRFAAEQADTVAFYAYLQWLADEQLTAAGAHSAQRGLGVGLYQDLAVGVNPGGADTWGRAALYAAGAHIGAPPDTFNLRGQDWGLAPPLPSALREQAYAPFIAALRAVMRPCGVLRIDHVMGLMRLWWVPAGMDPADGAYVAYPFRDLLGILALESQRNQCLVVGEDLGTVPDALRAALAAAGVLGCRLLLFEHDADGRFKPPADYPAQALVAVGTHDLPTLRGYWLGRDLRLREELGLFPSPTAREQAVAERARQRAWLLAALERERLLPDGTGIDPQGVPDVGPELGLAVHRFLARTPCRLLAMQARDLFGLPEQDNLPGSSDGHPNWRRKLPPLERWAEEPRWQALTAALRAERGSGLWPRQPVPAAPASAIIPRATYRLQFNRDFTFAQATELVPYLAELGISHVYASPYLRARPGSGHGYDIVDHNALNPEIGSREDFERLVGALAAHGMGHILDMVPNHMGVMGADNRWWLDVLENGPASVYAEYFDIDWQPLNPRLHGKVLLPILGDQYGVVLARGELALTFDAACGEFSVFYHQHRLPIDPAEYPRIAGRHLDQLSVALGAGHEHLTELQSLLTGFGHLPPRHATEPRLVTERQRDKEVHKRRLAALCEAQPAIRQHLERNVAEFNGRAGDAASFDLLHELIHAQAWRPAYWRVALDDINYRRFFDINDLAALRMESPAVFDDTHRLVLELIGQRKLDGLRIDHPDGLNDPRGYFERLQAAVRQQAGGADDPRPLYLVVEKILAEHERLPTDWPVHGTTGYRFANLVGGLFVDPAAERRMARIHADFTHTDDDFDELVYACKKLILRTALTSELNVLANQLAHIAAASRDTCDYTVNGLRGALAEVIACFPVYRTYITDAPIAADDRRHIDWAVAVARRRSRAAEVGIFEFLRGVLTLDIASGRGPSYRDRVRALARRFQQLSAPVMAKGLEDTAFYRHHRLVALNEVGSDGRRFGISVAAFHSACRAQQRDWPHGLLATSTHDSKRSEDVRARIAVLSELPAAWKLTAQRWRRLNRRHLREVGGRPAPSAADEYLLYQTLIGSFPLGPPDAAALADYRARIDAYLQKAAREAKVDTSWINVDTDYEAALSGFVQALLTPGDGNPFLAELVAAVQRLAGHGLRNALAQTLLKLTAPGVPDIYQGSELWQFQLVDPDNRRPVDYALRQRLLAEIKGLLDGPPDAWPTRLAPLMTEPDDGRIKLYITWRALQLRARRPELFRDGDYRPLPAAGAGAEHLCAFARTLNGQAAVTVVPRLLARFQGEREGAVDWADTRLELPTGDWYDLLGGRQHTVGAAGMRVQDLLTPLPLALLVDDADLLTPS